MTNDGLMDLSLRQLRGLLHGGDISSVELTEYCLARLDSGKMLNSSVCVDEVISRRLAKQADTLFSRGQAGPLTGIPVAHKDLFVTKDFPTSAGSKMLDGYMSPFNAHVVDLLERAGMVCVGKMNCDEFGMGSGNEHSAFGPTRNPWMQNYVPGGSSGGCAAAVSARLVPAATATDTGGSIRQPASFCGITGIKPTYGMCSRYGIVPFASSLDQAGPMAKTAEDCAVLLDAMVGHDVRDSTSVDRKVALGSYEEAIGKFPQRSESFPLMGIRLGIPKEFLADGTASYVREAIVAAAKVFSSLGAEVVDVSLPRTSASVAAYYIIGPAEASSNLARYDGVRYGYRSAGANDLLEMYVRSRTEAFGAEVKRRILIGTYVLSHGYYDALYVQAQRVRRAIAMDFQDSFKRCDLLIGPVAPDVAWKIGAQSADPVLAYLADIFTLPASLAGLPAMSVPAGFSPIGLPIGLQIIGNYFQESTMLSVAHKYQLSTTWHLAKPQMGKSTQIAAVV